MPRRHEPLGVCCVVGLLLAIASSGLRAGPTAAFWTADPAQEDASRFDGSSWIADGTGFSMRLRRFSDDERKAYLERATGFAVDPFAGRADAPGYLTFFLEVENRSKGTVLFHPQSCWLITNKNEVRTPVGVDDLRSSYGLMGEALPPAFQHASKAILEGSRTLSPGEATSGLLIFRSVKPRTRAFRLDVQLVGTDGNPVKLRAAYHRVEPKPADAP